MANILECRHIDKTYQTGKLEVPVLYDVNFTMEEGEYVAIMGPSGSGKSTLMNIIGCLDRLTDGELYLDGEPVSSLSEKELARLRLRKVGFVFQTFQLLPGETALENVELPLAYAKVPRKNRREIALRALERVGLSDRVDFRPSQLSGGQKQRVAIARAVVNHPKILLADEPTGALDSKSGRQVMELFRSLNEEGMSVLMITHDREIASYADRIVEIRDGVLMDAQGVPMKKPELSEKQAGGRAAAVKTGSLQAAAEDGFFDDVEEETGDELSGGFFEDAEEPESLRGLSDAAGVLKPGSEKDAPANAGGTELFGGAMPDGIAARPAEAAANAGETDGNLPDGLVTRLTDADIDAGLSAGAVYAAETEAVKPENSRRREAAFAEGSGKPEKTAETDISDEAAIEVLHLAAGEKPDADGTDITSADVRRFIDESGSRTDMPEEV